MRHVSCDITFPYNWCREFYCGERLQLSVEVRCAKSVTVRGVKLYISCQNLENEPDDEYGRYIDDIEEDVVSNKKVTEFITEIDLLGNDDEPVQFASGTHIFSVDCHLPERIGDQNCDKSDQLSLWISVRIKKAPLKDEACPLEVDHCRKRQTNFTWPGSFERISNYSNVRVDIESFHASNVEEENNRLCCSEDDDEFLENWLGAIPMQGELSDEDS
ncbi:uncharacterized protein LOC135704159 [Ochlerotatus camptorhynchus]|uniref:uncharacterized protein LOC135704159 n=1 Tax=Ochlerotatus camptorhynchus TaxID=644619 RepID=UPI0031E3B3F2